MADKNLTKSSAQLLKENEELRVRLAEAEEALSAIRNGEVDAIVVAGRDGDHVFSITSAETPYRILLEEMDEGAVSATEDGTILYCNAKFATMISHPASDIIGSDLRRFIIPGERPLFTRLLKEGLKGKANRVLSFSNNNARLPVHLKVSIKALPEGMTGKVSIITSDVTEMKQQQKSLESQVDKDAVKIKIANDQLRKDLIEIGISERALRASEERLSSVYQTMSDGLASHELIYDQSGNPVDYLITDVNPAFEKITRLKKKDITGRKATEAYAVTDAPYLEIYAEVATSGMPASFETYFPPMNKHFHVSVFSPGKNRFATVFQDITERKHAEEELRAIVHKFYLILSNLQSGILLITDEDQVEFINQTFCDIFGLKESPTEFLNLSSDEMITKIKDCYKYPESALKRIRDILKKGKQVIGEDVEMLSEKTLLRDFIPIKVAGKLTGRLWNHIDITERKLISDTQDFLLINNYPASGQDFFESLAKFLSRILDMDYVCIDKLEGDHLQATTVAVFNDGRFDPNITYTLKETPCGDVVGKMICCFPKNVSNLFPNDSALKELNAESYVGTTLWSFDGKPIGLIAVIGRKPLRNRHLAEAVLKLASIRAAGELERKKNDDSLRDSEKKFSTVFNAAPVAMSLATVPDGRMIDVNQTWLNLLKIKDKKDVVGKTSVELGLIPDAGSRQKILDAFQKYGSVNNIEITANTRDGKTIDMLVNVLMIEISGTKCSLSTNSDITELKQADRALRISEERFRTLIQYAPAVIYEMNIQGSQYLSVNDTMCQILGYSREELIRIKPIDLLDDTSQENFRARVKKRLAGKNIDEDIEYRVRKKNGEWIYALITVGNITFSTAPEPTITIIAYDITERKKMEEALRESEKKFRELVKYAPTAIYEVDFIKRKFVTVNDAMCLLSGYTREELLSIDALNILADESKALFISRIKRCMQGELPDENVEYKVRSKDGRIISAILNMKFNFNDQGIPVGAMVVGHDITQRKREEEAVRESESKFISIFNMSPLPMALSTSEDGVIHDVNDSFIRDSGYAREEIIGKTTAQLNLFINFEIREQILNKVKSKGSIQAMPCDFRLKNGTILNTLLSTSAITINNTSYLLSTIQNITEILQAREALRESEERFRTLTENIPDMIVRFDKDLKFVYGNLAVVNRTGLPLESLIGKTAVEYSKAPESARYWEKSAREVLSTGEPKRIQQTNQWQGITQVYDALLVPERDSNGNISSIISIGRDISEMKRLENILKESEQRLRYHLENSPLAVVEWDKNFRIMQWSAEAERIFGFKKEEILGERLDLITLIYKDDLQEVEKTISRLVSGKELKIISHNRNITRTGEILDCIWYNSVLLDETGEMSSVMSLVEDITLLKRIEKELLESRENYKELITNARTIIIKMDTEGRCIFVNEYGLSFFGFNPEDILEIPVMDTIMPKTESTGRDLGKMAEEIIGDPDTYSVNINENVKKNGDRVWVEWHNKALFDQEGNRTGHIGIGVDVTQKKMAEEALRESERKLWSVLNATLESIYMFDKKGIICMSNSTGIKRLRKKVENEVIGHHFSEFMTPETTVLRQEKLDEVFAKGFPVEFEDQRDCNTYHHNFFPVFNDNKVSYVVSYSLDITERRNNELKLKESEDRLRSIAESLTVMISITKKCDSTTSYINDPYLKTYGFTKEELIGKHDPDIFVFPKDRKELKSILRLSGSVDNRELKVRKADGTEFWIITSIRTINFMGETSFLASSIDITETKKAQEELLRLNRTLDAHNKSSQAMMHSNNEFNYLNEVCKIIIEDCGHSMVWIGYAQNDARKTVLPVAHYGFEIGYIEQLNISWDNSERGNGPTGLAIKTGKPAMCKNMLTDPAFDPWRKAAIERGYASSLVLPLTTDGKPFGAISIYSKEPDPFTEPEINLLTKLADDLAYGISFIRLTVSEREAARVIKESEAKLKDLVATKDKFFNIIAHDLKNPFTSMLGSSELLYDNINSMTTDNVRKLALILNDSAKGGYAILQNLLDWSRSQTGLLKFNPEKLNLRLIINENVENLQLQVTNKEIDLRSELENDLFILADKNMINTVLRNLLSNAVKYTFKGGSVVVRADNITGEVIITVKDSGIGISKQKADTLFRIENSLSVPKKSQKEQGTGLGLKLCKEFTEKMGGRIWIESKVGEGSEFKFTIPVKA